MVFTLIAVLVGFAVAFVLGGRLSHLADRGFRWWVLLPVGLVLQWLLERAGAPWPFGLLLVSYACLLGFGVANLRMVGMWMVTLGFALNAIVIATNHGMPVSNQSLRALDVKGRITEVKHHAQRSSDKLLFLADVIPVPPIGQALSFGDMILSVGIVDVLVNLMRPRRRRHDADAPSEEWPTEPWQTGGKQTYEVSSTGVVDLAPTGDEASAVTAGA